MIVHISADEKFIDGVIDNFEKYNEGNNRFLVIHKTGSLNYIKNIEAVTTLPPNHNDLLKICNAAQLVILHCHPYGLFKELYKINDKTKLLWSTWGMDFYMLAAYRRKFGSLYEPITQKKVWHSRPHIKQLILDFLTPFIFKYRLKSYKRINYISTVLNNEFEIIKHILPLNNECNFIKYSYGDLKTVLGPFYGLDHKMGDNVLVGNSASYTSNHIDTFKVLDSLGFKNKVVCPLSYGEERCKKDVINGGVKYFNEQLVAITDFLDINSYLSIIKSCSTLIINSRRQQAVGNIIIGLYLGMKVYLNPRSTSIRFFKENGFIVFDFSKIKKQTEPFKALSKHERDNNRLLLEKIWGEERLKEQVQIILDLVSCENIE